MNKVDVITFGYKYGKPPKADVEIDVRQLPNPVNAGWQHILTEDVMKKIVKSHYFTPILTNSKQRIESKLMSNPEKPIVVAIGCHGGKHRSVAFAYFIQEWLRSSGVESKITHRDRGR